MNYQKPKAKRGDSKKTRRQVTKVSKNEFLFWSLKEKWKLLRDGQLVWCAGRKLYSSTPTFEKKQITQKVLCAVKKSLKEMTGEWSSMQQPFWGYEIWLGLYPAEEASACFIMLHWIFYLIDSRALVKNVHSYLFLPSNREVYGGVNCLNSVKE